MIPEEQNMFDFEYGLDNLDCLDYEFWEQKHTIATILQPRPYMLC